jgi:pyruvate,water dikinase
VARVVQTLEEAKALQPGEILVTVTTMPAWTPLFGAAAAVVTETGGALSHCAIVAREYGIPAVVGAFGATRAIKTGQVISVDGTNGTVSIETD